MQPFVKKYLPVDASGSLPLWRGKKPIIIGHNDVLLLFTFVFVHHASSSSTDEEHDGDADHGDNGPASGASRAHDAEEDDAAGERA